MCVLLLHCVPSLEGNWGRVLFFGFIKEEGHNFQDRIKRGGGHFLGDISFAEIVALPSPIIIDYSLILSRLFPFIVEAVAVVVCK